MRYEIGSRIRKYREEKGLSQKEFSKLIGVSNSRVSNWNHLGFCHFYNLFLKKILFIKRLKDRLIALNASSLVQVLYKNIIL